MLIPLVIGGGVAAQGLVSMIHAIEAMPRVVVPGSGPLDLEAGDHVLYVESRSRWQGTTYAIQSFELRCQMLDPAGEPIAMATPTMQTEYEVNAYAGSSVLTVSIPHAGTYQLRCKGSGEPTTIAVGSGIGGRMLRVLLGVLGGLAAASVTLWAVRRQRRRAREAEAREIPAARVVSG